MTWILLDIQSGVGVREWRQSKVGIRRVKRGVYSSILNTMSKLMV